LKKILGIPTKEKNEKLIYRNSWQRKMTAEEVKIYSGLFGESVRKKPNLNVLVAIDAIFSKSGLEYIEIVQSIFY
jgi:hypothetical protein